MNIPSAEKENDLPSISHIEPPQTMEELRMFLNILINEPAAARRAALAAGNPEAFAAMLEAERGLLWYSRTSTDISLHNSERMRAAGILSLLATAQPVSSDTAHVTADVRAGVARTLEPQPA